jgi:alkaline phosphatase isozyme conversion protein
MNVFSGTRAKACQRDETGQTGSPLSWRCPVLVKILALVLAILPVFLPLAGCSETDPTVIAVANYGSYGSDQALKLALAYPFRSPGSASERGAGDLIIKSLKDLGYQPIVTEFTFTDKEGTSHKSRNIAVLIEGSGFTWTKKDGKTENIKRQVIIGAHYDTPLSAEQSAATETDGTVKATGATTETGTDDEPGPQEYNGIHDNASGIGALLVAAREMKKVRYGYDIVLIAFGAGSSDQAGAKYYASQMSKDEIAATDAMYCLEAIYAGDKVYAHAGPNSLKANYKKDYDKRRKLYEVTDVFYEFELYTNNNFMLYTNMSSIDVTVDGIFTPVLYREWTKNKSDYLPFDALDIPIVFFESFNYDEKTLEAMQESKNPAFGSTGGMIRGTHFDSAGYLKQILNTKTSSTGNATSQVSIDQLTKRINNIAFILVEAILRGPADTVIQ